MVKPMAKPMAKAIVKSRSKVAPQCLGAVLVAEDNAVNQKIIERHLTRMGLDVKIVENGLQAVESCEIIDFDLVLMDIQMPVMDGVAAAKKIKVNGNAPPIIAITANTLKEDLETYRAVGIDKVIRKPINAESFYETVAPFLKGQQ
jgi:CheY-like chemotaxis protein